MSTVDRPENVLALPRRGEEGESRLSRIGVQWATFAQLDELAVALRQLSPHMGWSAQQCMIASTPLRMRLTIARRRVNDVTISGLPDDQDCARWVLEFNDACLEAGRKLREIETCLHTLQRAEISLAERCQGTEIFASSKSGLLTVLDEISHLIGHWRTRGTTSGAAVADERRELNSDLSEIGQRLQAMIAAYEEKPSAIDTDILGSAHRKSGIAEAIVETYKIMNNRVYSDGSCLRVDDDLWEASKEQRGEFIHFYRSALVALETYRKVLKTYLLLEEQGSQLQHGWLERTRQDMHTQVEERARCIEAVSNFEGKFAAILAALDSINGN